MNSNNKLKQISRNILFIFSFLSLVLPTSVFAAAGTPDTTFTTNMGDPGLDNVVRASVVLSNDKIVVGGSFNYLNDIIDANYVAGFNSDGTPDTTFNTNLGTGFSDAVYAMAVQSDDKIVVGGSFTGINGTTSNRIARLNSDGTLDTTFTTNIGTGFGATRVNTIAIQSDGKIVVGGSFSTINGVTSNRIARLNSDGTPDTTFTTNIGTGFGSSVYRVGIQSDGKIIAGGIFSTLNDVSTTTIARLNSDGTPDTTFTTNIGTGFDNDVQTLAVLSNDKIVVGGLIENFNGTSIHFFTGLNSDGTLDTTFNTNLGTGFGNFVETIAIQSDNKIIVGGSFTTINGVTSNRIARLSSVGIPDTTFTTNIGTGFDGTTRTIAFQSDGKIIVGGAFGSVNSVTSNYVARLDGDVFAPTVTTGSSSAITTTTATLAGNITVTGGENSTTRGVEYGLTTGYGTTSSASGSFSTGAYTTDITGLTCGTTYHYRAYSTNTAGTGTGSDDTFTTSTCPVVASTNNTSSGSSAGSRASNLFAMGKVTEANKILQQFPNAINEIKDANTKNALSNTNTENSNSNISGSKITKKLIKGMKDNEVKILQTVLNKVLKLGLTVDGVFGQKTKDAVMQFQKANNLKADGVVGPITRGVLNKLL